MTPELVRHKRNLTASNASARVWTEVERFGELQRLCGILASHASSAGEAAWREDQALMALHLGRAREALILALRVAKE